MRIGGRWAAHPAVAAVRQRARQATRTPAFGIAAIMPLVFAAAVGGAPAPLPGKSPAVHAAVTPVAAVSASGRNLRANPTGPGVVAISRAPARFHVAAATISAPPPPTVVNTPGTLGIPKTALAAYRNAELKMAAAAPGCGVSWNLLAGIGRIESGHAGGGAVDVRGTAINPIYGPALDGTLPGNEVIIQNTTGNRVTYARAMGPMQFLPGTWARYATDGDGDGIADPQNLFDATLAAARYLCSGGLNLRDPNQVMAAILRYNNSVAYAQNVLGWAAAYATGVVPVDLPPITGPPPPIGDGFLEHPEGLGPSMPLNHTGLPLTDPFAGRTPLIDLSGQPQLISTQPMFPWMAPPATQGPAPLTLAPGCTLICIGSQNPGPGPGPLPAGTSPQPSDVVAPFGQAPPAAGTPSAEVPVAPPPANPAAGAPNASPAPKKPAGAPAVPNAPAPAAPSEPAPPPPA